jgi:hypothetical protein
MRDTYDSYSRVRPYTLEGIAESGSALTNYWYSPKTVNSEHSAKAVLLVNGGTTTSCNLYSYSGISSTTTNLLFLSENIRSGLTAQTISESTKLGQGWSLYSATHPTSPTNAWSNIRMPDGSTNGVVVRIARNTVNGGIYQPLTSSSVLGNGKVYTLSVWAAGDSGGGVYTANQAFRMSYFNRSTSVMSQDFHLSETPTRYSFTFVANSNTSDTTENVAFGNPSGSGVTTQIVIWGAQLVEGNTAGAYLPTSTAYNGFITGNSVGSTTTTTGSAGSGFKTIDSIKVTVPANSSSVVNVEAFSAAWSGLITSPPPSEFAVYGLY